jgi:purine-binding chemotaxis protein CheW
VVTLGGRVFAFEITAVREVAEFDDLTAVPLAPPHVLGVANLRGDVVPVVDPSAALGLPAEAPGRRLRTLVVAADGLSAALRVDAVAGLEVLETSAVGPAAPWARAALEREGHPIPLVDAGALLAGLRPAERREA